MLPITNFTAAQTSICLTILPLITSVPSAPVKHYGGLSFEIGLTQLLCELTLPGGMSRQSAANRYGKHFNRVGK
jgi:hypothetical protein